MRRPSFEQQDVGLVCSSCRTRSTRKLFWLRANNQFVCTNCGANVNIDSRRIIAGLEQAQRAFDDFLNKLGGQPN